MTSGTSEIHSRRGGAGPLPPITTPLRALRRRLGIWRFRRWVNERPQAIQITAGDTWRHLRLTAAGERHIHVVRETTRPNNWDFFRWLEAKHPEHAGLFRHTTTGGLLSAPVRGTALLIPWIRDPVRERDPLLFQRLLALESRHMRAGIPIVNPVSHLSNAIKSTALARLRQAGFTTARTLALSPQHSFGAVAAAVGLPFIVRNDQGHGGYVRLVRSSADFRQIDWSQLIHPVALEYIETQSADGFYRKYRFVVAGDSGISRHMIVARSWCVHAADRVRGQSWADEEQAFLEAPNPYEEPLVRAARALALDFVAFDYSIDANDRLVIWEPNPFPRLWPGHYSEDRYYDFQHASVDKLFNHMLRFYLRRANMETALQEQRDGCLC
ncbi:MAG TPA: hypothetical protein VFH85_09860 [Gammaproteobacteria bacterium]|nr:hypothetical protein [Gammaproteobacteria bacterium]